MEFEAKEGEDERGGGELRSDEAMFSAESDWIEEERGGRARSDISTWAVPWGEDEDEDEESEEEEAKGEVKYLVIWFVSPFALFMRISVKSGSRTELEEEAEEEQEEQQEEEEDGFSFFESGDPAAPSEVSSRNRRFLFFGLEEEEDDDEKAKQEENEEAEEEDRRYVSKKLNQPAGE